MTDTLLTPERNLNEEPVAFDARTRRVMQLRMQVRAGAYRPDHREIAEAILDEWLATPELTTSADADTSLDSCVGRRTIAARFVVAKSEPEVVGDSTARTA